MKYACFLILLWASQFGLQSASGVPTSFPAGIAAEDLHGLIDGQRELNSGHTFHETEFAALNYLLFPRLGDWAILKVTPGAKRWQPGASDFPEEVVQAGYFNEAWKTGP